MKIKHTAIKKYIEQSGWKHTDTIRYGTEVYRKKNELETILIPVDTALSDYDFLIDKAIEYLSETSDSNKDLIYERIIFSNCDIVRFRLDTPLAKDGTLPLEIWIKHYELTVSAIKAAAQTIIKDKSKQNRFTTGQAASFANNCKIGQTEVGSYITKALIPLGTFSSPLMDTIQTSLASEPYGRQLSVALMQSADIIERATSELETTSAMPSLEALATNKSMATLTRKLCSSYEELVELSKSKANLFIALQSSNELPINSHINSNISKIESKFIEHIKEIRNVISVNYLPKIDTLEGFITRLEQDTSDPEATFGKVTLFTGDRKVNIILNEDLYKKALKAHEGKAPVNVRGILNKRSGRWHLDNVEDVLAFERQL